jgi:putative tricarboxylic transport membrane protein
MIFFGVVGYLMKKFGFEPGPMVLAFVLGSLIESSFRRSMLIFEGDASGFVTRPISGTILAFVVLVIAFPLIKRALRRTTPATDTTPETVQREDSLR